MEKKTGEIINIDSTLDEYPKIIERGYESQDYILAIIDFGNGECWEGKVVTISTSGRYSVELIKKTSQWSMEIIDSKSKKWYN